MGDTRQTAERRTRRFLGEEATSGSAGLPGVRVTRCYTSQPVDSSLTEKRIVQALAVSVVAASLCIAHLWLQFAAADSRIQFRQLQERRRELQGRMSLLQHENERLCDIERLREYGDKNLNMIETNPARRVLAHVPAEYRARYSRAKPEANVLAYTTQEARPLSRTERVLLMLTDVNRAFAGQ